MAESKEVTSPLDLRSLAPIFVSRTHLSDDELQTLEEDLEAAGAALTYNILEARIIMSKVKSKVRLAFDLRAMGLEIEEAPVERSEPTAQSPTTVSSPIEVITIDDSSTASENEPRLRSPRKRRRAGKDDKGEVRAGEDLIRIVDLKWFEDSRQAGHPLPFNAYVSLEGTRKSVRAASNDQFTPDRNASPIARARFQKPVKPASGVVQRAKEDNTSAASTVSRSFRHNSRRSLAQGPSTSTASWSAGRSKIDHAHLLHATTSEEDHGYSNDLPEPPEWVVKEVKYACQRSTPSGNVNEPFISQLRKIKLARLLTSDEIGVRAYSTSIAAILAYPYKLITPREILRLPGCDAKIANLFVEWTNTGKLKAVEDSDADHDLQILRTFYDIWGVGALTAREFYYEHGWQDLDDLVDYNWQGLSRIQQIGVKFYEEFLEKISRAEVEQIGGVVHRHAVSVRDTEIQSMIVGGYRRGKAESGDVDIIVSHPDESKTLNIIADIVASLENEGWITHTLLLSLNSTHRDQQTLPFRSGNMHGGHGFDNLDKAFVVWQDPAWPSREADLAADPKAKNKNVHRRVDIIIAPWRTVGCAVLGWSGGTTFQRDVRRFVKHKYGWKFDSSGVRDRSNGDVEDLEGFTRYTGKLGVGRAKDMLQAEKRVFEGLGLDYVEPTNRCTD